MTLQIRETTPHNASDFKLDCKYYLLKKKKIQEILENKTYLLGERFFDEAKIKPEHYQKLVLDKEVTELELSILKASVETIDNQFSVIETELGQEIKNMMYEKLIEGKSIEEVAHKYYIHPNTFKKRQNDVLKLLGGN